MEYIVRECNGPPPPGWVPGSPLPSKYRYKKIEKVTNAIEFTYKQTHYMFVVAGKKKVGIRL